MFRSPCWEALNFSPSICEGGVRRARVFQNQCLAPAGTRQRTTQTDDTGRVGGTVEEQLYGCNRKALLAPSALPRSRSGVRRSLGCRPAIGRPVCLGPPDSLDVSSSTPVDVQVSSLCHPRIELARSGMALTGSLERRFAGGGLSANATCGLGAPPLLVKSSGADVAVATVHRPPLRFDDSFLRAGLAGDLTNI